MQPIEFYPQQVYLLETIARLARAKNLIVKQCDNRRGRDKIRLMRPIECPFDREWARSGVWFELLHEKSYDLARARDYKKLVSIVESI